VQLREDLDGRARDRLAIGADEAAAHAQSPVAE
jgi:hypothetical protein